MSIARGTSHIASVEDGADAVWYEINPDTYAVSLDADGEWVDGTDVVAYQGEECARIKCTYSEHIGGKVQAPEEYVTLVFGDWFDVGHYFGYAFIKKTDTSVNLSLYKFNKDNPPMYTGELLAKCTVTVNRAGANGNSVKVQFSADGSNDWHDAYKDGDRYMRIHNGSGWSDAIKFVGDNGTSFNIKGTVMDHYEKSSMIPSPAAVADRFIVDKHDVGTSVNKPCYVECTDISGTLSATEASVGDAYKTSIDDNLWVASDNGWVNLGNIKGADGTSVYIMDESVTYGISDSPDNPASVLAWNKKIQQVTSAKPYLWTKIYVKYSDGTVTTSYSVATRGNRGAVFRQHTGFVNGTFSYQSGTGAEEFIDVVRSDSGVWYRCIKSYDSQSVPAANDLTNTTYWSTNGMSNMEFVATELLLAQNATINMMGTNEINVYDENSDMFGSFRVPHGKSGVDGDVDGGEYAMWLGGKLGKYAPYSVTKGGKLYARDATVSGEINATSGYIGGFRINEDFIGSMSGYNMYLTDKYIHFGSAVALASNDGCTVNLGERQASTGGDRALEIMSVAGDGHNVNVGGLISVMANNTKNSYCAALELQSGWAEGAGTIDVSDPQSGNHAILIHSGDVPGLRPSFTKVSSDVTMSVYHHTVLMVNTKDITVTLPDSPPIGQEYIFINHTSNWVYFKSKHNINVMNANYNSTSWRTEEYNRVCHFWFDGTEWLVKY